MVLVPIGARFGRGALLLAFASACAAPGDDGAAVEALELDAPLGATMSDPVLLTFAAARARSRYLVDEGYSIELSPGGGLELTTDTAGSIRVAFTVDGVRAPLMGSGPRALSIDHLASDAAVLRAPLTDELVVEARVLVVDSSVLRTELVVESASAEPRRVAFTALLRRCGAPFSKVVERAGRLEAEHRVEPPLLLGLLAGETHVAELRGSFALEGGPVERFARAACDDEGAELTAAEAPDGAVPANAEVLGARSVLDVPPKSRRAFVVTRAVVALDDAPHLEAEVARARAVSTIELVEEGRARVDGHPRLARGTPASDLGVRSAFVLLDQLFMPAEGHVAHDYFVFSREPTWWFARLGEHLHEGLALIPLARVEPERAMGALRIFAERVEDDGYVPYSIGPVVEQTALRTASAPLFAYVASEVAQRTGDAAFAREASTQA